MSMRGACVRFSVYSKVSNREQLKIELLDSVSLVYIVESPPMQCFTMTHKLRRKLPTLKGAIKLAQFHSDRNFNV